jgi:hypothetical protein
MPPTSRRNPGWIDVRDYGARGNNSADDTTAIQAALTAAASSGREVYLPPGTYRHGDLVRPGGVFVRGAGQGRTTLLYTGSGTAWSVPASGVRTYRGGFRDLTISTTTGAVGIDLDSVSLAHVQGIEVNGFSAQGIRLRSSISGGCVYNRFHDVKVQSVAYPNSAVGLSIEAGSSNANTFLGCRTNLCNVGFLVADSNDNSFFGCQAETGGTGFRITASSSGLSGWNRLFGCRAENNAVYGVDIASSNVNDTVIAGLWTGSNGTDYNDLGTRTHRATDQMYVNSLGLIQFALAAVIPSITLSSTSGALAGATNTPLYLRGSVPDNASAVGAWIGNSPTLTNAAARIVGFCRDTAVTHAEPVAYVRRDGAYEFTNGVLILTGSGTPEGNVTAPVGSLYLRSDGGAGTSLYVKQSGTGSTGWAGK